MIAATSAAYQKSCLAVAGMHRSGTSALMGTFVALGCEMPKHLLVGDMGNEKGYFEPSLLIEINNALLTSAGLAWDDWDPFPSAWWDSAARALFDEQVTAFLDAEYEGTLIGIKDPRICRTLPVLTHALQQRGIEPLVVLPWRSVSQVAQSMGKRGGYLPDQCALIWLRYLLDAESHSRPFRRSFLGFDDLLRDWRGIVARIEQQVGLSLPSKSLSASEKVDAFLDGELRHFNAARGVPISGGLLAWIDAVTKAYRAFEHDPHDPGSQAELDRIGRELDAVSIPVHCVIKAAHESMRGSGRTEGRAPGPPPCEVGTATAVQAQPDLDAEFDRDDCLRHDQDIARPKIDPLWHHVNHGRCVIDILSREQPREAASAHPTAVPRT